MPSEVVVRSEIPAATGTIAKFPAQAEQGIPSGVSGNRTFDTGNLSGDQGTEGTSFDQGAKAVLHSIYSSGLREALWK